jgi:hypothetical protein
LPPILPRATAWGFFFATKWDYNITAVL